MGIGIGFVSLACDDGKAGAVLPVGFYYVLVDVDYGLHTGYFFLAIISPHL